MTGKLAQGALVQQIVDTPGVTLQLLRRCLYAFKKKSGLCVNDTCSREAEPGMSRCLKHQALLAARVARCTERRGY